MRPTTLTSCRGVAGAWTRSPLESAFGLTGDRRGGPHGYMVPCCRSLLACQPTPEDGVIAVLGEIAERMVSLTLGHLTYATLEKLTADELSVHAYPSRYGGFLYVGKPAYDRPEEADLAVIFRFAEQAGIAWLHFDAGGATLDGLPLYAG